MIQTSETKTTRRRGVVDHGELLHLFWEWVRTVENDEDCIFIFSPVTGLVWCNTTLRDLLGTDQPGLVPWTIFRNWIHHEGLAKVEDTISLALKLTARGGESPILHVDARVKPDGLRFIEGDFTMKCLDCKGHRRRRKPCVAIMVLFRRGDEEVEAPSFS